MIIEKQFVERMSSLLPKALKEYEKVYAGLEFQNFNPFIITSNKPNSARTIIPVKYCDKPIGEMYAIAFQYKDGTGDAKTFQLGQLAIPEKLQEFPQEKVLPRKKEGISCEGCFPLFSAFKDHTNWFTISLEEIIVDNPANPKSIKKAGDLGLEPSYYQAITNIEGSVPPEIYFTTGYKDGKRFGDPHAIYNSVNNEAMQVAGFLAVKETINGLKFANNWKLPKENY
jgi:hypothetical protein